VVADVSLAIPEGEFFTLLGPSGSGKTTTLSMLAGFVVPDEGRVMLGGQDMTRVPPRGRGLGMVFQNYAIFPHLNVAENVAFPLTVKGAPKAEIQARVAEALEMVKLTGFETRYARQLSGGQQQRVALARAIVGHPKVVLMDEPLGALDKNLRYHMQVEIKEIQQRLGMTVIYVTHDQEEALTMSDRIAIMNHGRIAQMGPPREVYEPGSSFVAAFLGEANLLKARRDGAAIRGPGGAGGLARGALDGAGGLVFVRPEKVSVPPARPSAAPNHLPGRIQHASFLGNIVRYAVTAAEGATLLCDAANGAGTADPSARRRGDAELARRRQPAAGGLSSDAARTPRRLAHDRARADPAGRRLPLPIGWFLVGSLGELGTLGEIWEEAQDVLFSGTVAARDAEHQLDRLPRDAAGAGDRLSALLCAVAREGARLHGHPALHRAALLHQHHRPHLCLDGAAGAQRADQPDPARPRPRRCAAGAHVQPHRRHHRHDLRAAALHGADALRAMKAVDPRLLQAAEGMGASPARSSSRSSCR
jgi:spermidine/putrescine ABC transporter ATP-binding subunit